MSQALECDNCKCLYKAEVGTMTIDASICVKVDESGTAHGECAEDIDLCLVCSGLVKKALGKAWD